MLSQAPMFLFDPGFDENGQMIHNESAEARFVMLVVLLFLLAAWGYYRIAKAREIKKPWLAWIPVAHLWILGSISDQYRRVHHGQDRIFRKLLLILGITANILRFGGFALLDWLSSSGLVNMETGEGVWLQILGIVLLGNLLFGMALARMILRFFALNDLFRSCVPRHAKALLVLSIVLIPLGPVLTLLVSGRHDGFTRNAAEETAQNE